VELSLAEQLGHVGSEVSRAVRWQSRNPDVARRALYRALELFDLTLADRRHRANPARLREIAGPASLSRISWLAESVWLHGPSLQKYFDAFAVAARRSSGGAARP